MTWRQVITACLVLLAAAFIWGLSTASASASAATRQCGDAWGGGLRFENIRSGGLSCRKARQFAAQYVPRAYSCRYSVQEGRRPEDAVFRYRCWRDDRPRWFRFTLR